MRIDPKSTVAGHSALGLRQMLRKLRQQANWTAAEFEAATGVKSGQGRSLIRRLRAEGLVEPAGSGVWTVTQAGRTFAAATAGKRVTRSTAERALKEFLERVARVNADPYFLGKVVRVVLYGSLLHQETDRPSDVDLAVEIAPKETDFERLTAQNYERVEHLRARGRRFRSVVEITGWWHWEVFGFLKGRSRVISLADYKVEKALVLAVPHRLLLGDDEPAPKAMAPEQPRRRPRRPRDCPF
jgi:predicted nucleotidyltransferase